MTLLVGTPGALALPKSHCPLIQSPHEPGPELFVRGSCRGSGAQMHATQRSDGLLGSLRVSWKAVIVDD